MSAITERTDYGPAMSQLNERRRAFVTNCGLDRNAAGRIRDVTLHHRQPLGPVAIGQFLACLRDMISYMRRPGGFIIANHLSELLEEMASYHLDEKHNIVRIRDDLVSALRYSFMARRKGRILDMCEHYRRDRGVTSVQYAPRPTTAHSSGTRFARGTAQNRPYDLFTGLPIE
jgi:hypothetical protein